MRRLDRGKPRCHSKVTPVQLMMGGEPLSTHSLMHRWEELLPARLRIFIFYRFSEFMEMLQQVHMVVSSCADCSMHRIALRLS